MACKRCDYNGYTETFIKGWNGFQPMIKQCPDCKDSDAYAKRVSERLKATRAEIEKELPGFVEPRPKPQLKLVVNNKSDCDYSASPKPRPVLHLILGGKYKPPKPE